MLREFANINAVGIPAGELKYGTLNLIEDGTPVVVICPNDSTAYDTLADASERALHAVLARQHAVDGVQRHADEEAHRDEEQRPAGRREG